MALHQLMGLLQSVDGPKENRRLTSVEREGILPADGLEPARPARLALASFSITMGANSLKQISLWSSFNGGP